MGRERASPCQRRCRPPCLECLAAAAQTARGEPLNQDFSRFELVWYVALVGLGMAAFAFSAYLPAWMCLAAGPLVVAGICGPYQFRVYREAQRAEKGVCAACGYSLGRLPAERFSGGGGDFDLVSCPECGVWNGRGGRGGDRRAR